MAPYNEIYYPQFTLSYFLLRVAFQNLRWITGWTYLRPETSFLPQISACLSSKSWLAFVNMATPTDEINDLKAMLRELTKREQALSATEKDERIALNGRITAATNLLNTMLSQQGNSFHDFLSDIIRFHLVYFPGFNFLPFWSCSVDHRVSRLTFLNLFRLIITFNFAFYFICLLSISCCIPSANTSPFVSFCDSGSSTPSSLVLTLSLRHPAYCRIVRLALLISIRHWIIWKFGGGL